MKKDTKNKARGGKNGRRVMERQENKVRADGRQAFSVKWKGVGGDGALRL